MIAFPLTLACPSIWELPEAMPPEIVIESACVVVLGAESTACTVKANGGFRWP